jgi:hypothetical protein
MVDAPKRSVGETITQLVVIAILIAILIGAIIILRQYIESHNTSHSIANKPTFTFTCCAGLIPGVIYHPGETVHLVWTPMEDSPGDYPKRAITLEASLSNSFVSVQALKSNSTSVSSVPDAVFIATDQVRMSNRSGASPVTSLQIPLTARTGYSDLVTTVSQRDLSTTGASIIVIRRRPTN